eukprot:8152787-Pyramimonas_sp.AAC.1
MHAGRRQHGDDRTLPQQGDMITDSAASSLQGAPYASQSIRAYQHLSMPTARKPGERGLC